MTRVQTVYAADLHVGAGQIYLTIQDAINTASENDTIYVHNGTYNETINIAIKNLTIIGENIDNTIINAISTGNVVNITADDITISGFTITNAKNHGVYLELVKNTTIYNCNIHSNNGSGIVIDSSNNNTITDCFIDSNNDSGILLSSSYNDSISDCNIVSNSGSGVLTSSSNDNKVTNCIIESNDDYGILLDTSKNNTVSYCSIESNGESGTYISSSNNNTFFDCTIADNGGSGIFIDSSKNNTISVCNIDSNYVSGIFIKSSNNNTISDCIIKINYEYGILIYAIGVGQTTDSNMIASCKLYDNGYCGIRITNEFESGEFATAYNNQILNCEFYDNGYDGEQDHTMAALSISPAGNVTNTTVADCIFYYSYGWDVHIEYGYIVENNTFYNNSFLSSSKKVWDERDSIWYNSNLSRGNYWACYDEESEDAYDSNSDGIIDDPYDIPGGNNQDLYPLTNPEYLGLYLPIAETNGPYSAYTDASITFDASGSYDNDSSHLVYDWDLGNGDIIYGKTAAYLYQLKGDYTVILTVEDDYGLTGTDTTTATITDEPAPPPPPPPPPTEPPTPPVNEAPTADVGGPYYEFAGISILFDGSDSNDVDGKTLKYKWDFGDGGTSSSRMPTYTYSKDENYTVKLTVTDEKGATDSDSTFALISKKPNNPPDKPKVSGIFKGSINTSLNLSVNGSDEDGDFIQYIINWSDGTNDTVSPLLENGTEYNTSHNFTTGGVYVVTVWTKDQNNATSDVQKCKFIIDSHSCGTLGYLVDKDGNGIYDVFYRETTGKETRVEQDGDDYTIDINGDEKWDYIYNFTTDKVQDYSSATTVNKEDSFTLDLKWVLLIIIIGAVGIYLIASNAIFKARNGKKIPIKKKKEKVKKVKKKEKKKKEKPLKTKKEKKEKKIPIITKPEKEKPVKKSKKKKIKAKKRIKIRPGKKTYAFDPKARKMKKMHKDIDRLLSEKKSTK